MAATGLLVLAIFVGILMLVVLGAAWFIAIPLAVLLFLVPVAFVSAYTARRTGVGAGDIVAVTGLKDSATGDTLCHPKHPIVLEGMSFADPVISMAIEPRSSADRGKLEQVLDRLELEDPTFHRRIDPAVLDFGSRVIPA